MEEAYILTVEMLDVNTVEVSANGYSIQTYGDGLIGVL